MGQVVTELDRILAARRERLEETRKRVPLESLVPLARERPVARDFGAALKGRPLSVIAESKRASPTRGMLREDYRPAEIARSYEAAGASALSVLTEEQFFLGSIEDLKVARSSVGLPVLRKDFILDPYQIYESAAAGADAVLLIVAALGPVVLQNLVALAATFQMAALVEVHTEDELRQALETEARIIGVNNRNLKTMSVRLETSLELRPRIPSDRLAVSESGIKTSQDMRRLADAGFDAVLIGERLMTADDPGGRLAAMLEATGDFAREKMTDSPSR